MARDIIHEAIKKALIKDGWKIIADPFLLRYLEFTLQADLAAEPATSGHGRSRLRIVVEVKSFVGKSFVHELQQALGQYQMYRDAIGFNQLDYDLYLAVSSQVFSDYFKGEAAQEMVQRYQIKLLVVSVAQEEVRQWIG